MAAEAGTIRHADLTLAATLFRTRLRGAFVEAAMAPAGLPAQPFRPDDDIPARVPRPSRHDRRNRPGTLLVWRQPSAAHISQWRLYGVPWAAADQRDHAFAGLLQAGWPAADFVRAVFSHMLLRPATEADSHFYEKFLHASQSREDLILNISESEEFSGIWSGMVAIAAEARPSP